MNTEPHLETKTLDPLRGMHGSLHKLWPLGFVIAFFMVSFYVIWVFVQSPGINIYKRAAFADMVYGRAARPFVTRALVPWTVRGIVLVTPDGLKKTIETRLLAVPFIDRHFDMWKWEKQYVYEYGVACAVMYLILLLYIGALCLAARYLFDLRAGPLCVLALFGLFTLPPFFKGASYLYDFSALFFAAILIAFMARRHWKFYFPLFVIACFNKETAILLTMVYFFYFIGDRRMKNSTFWLGLAGQVIPWLAARAILNRMYAGNPGVPLEYHFDWNSANYLLTPYSLKFLATGLVITILLAYDWHHKPRLLKTGLLIGIPCFIFMLFFGILHELRSTYEILPFGVLLSFHSLLAMFNHGKTFRTGNSVPA